MAGREDGKESSPSAKIEAEDASCRRRVRLFPLGQVGLGGICNSSIREVRTWSSLAGPGIDRPGAPSAARALFRDVRLGKDFSLCLGRLEQVPFALPQGLQSWGQSRTARLSVLNQCLGGISHQEPITRFLNIPMDPVPLQKLR